MARNGGMFSGSADRPSAGAALVRRSLCSGSCCVLVASMDLPRPGATAAQADFPEPTEIRAVDGVLRATLTAEEQEIEIAGQSHPGPGLQWRVRRADAARAAGRADRARAGQSPDGADQSPLPRAARLPGGRIRQHLSHGESGRNGAIRPRDSARPPHRHLLVSPAPAPSGAGAGLRRDVRRDRHRRVAGAIPA